MAHVVFNSNDTFPWPSGIKKVIAVTYGAGAGGSSGGVGESGGGGGAYSSKVILRSASADSLSVTVGSGGSPGNSGGDSIVSQNGFTEVLAKGGTPGVGFVDGVGGQASSGVGTIKFSGGNGLPGSGGSSATPIADGNTGTPGTGAIPPVSGDSGGGPFLGPELGGRGGDSGFPGQSPGGGGSGGQSGGDGKIVLYYNRDHSVTRFSSGCCCRVLHWCVNQPRNDAVYEGINFWPGLTSVFEEMGLIYDIVGDPENDPWAGGIDAYRLVIINDAGNDPMWWEDLIGIAPKWSGRVWFFSDSASTENDSLIWQNTKSGLSGLVSGVDSVPTTGGLGTIFLPADLTEGVESFAMGPSTASTVSGGTSLSETDLGSSTWLARNRVDGIDWVMSGHHPSFYDEPPRNNFSSSANNRQFVRNMWNVKIL